MTHILEGKTLAKNIREWLASEIEKLDFTPQLAAVQIGSDAASLRYIKSQLKAAEDIGAKALHIQFPQDITKEKFTREFKQIVHNPDIDAVILMTPLPKGWSADEFINILPAEKDIEGLHPENLGRLYLGQKDIPLPCTAHAALLLLEYYGFDFSGKNCVVIGRSSNVGRAAALLAMHKNATVTICHTKTTQAALDNALAKADVVISAAGKAGLIDPKKINKTAWIADVGTNFVDGKLVGDVAQFEAGDVQAISPVPGGIGPLTVALLLANLLLLATKRRRDIAIKLNVQDFCD